MTEPVSTIGIKSSLNPPTTSRRKRNEQPFKKFVEIYEDEARTSEELEDLFAEESIMHTANSVRTNRVDFDEEFINSKLEPTRRDALNKLVSKYSSVFWIPELLLQNYMASSFRLTQVGTTCWPKAIL